MRVVAGPRGGAIPSTRIPFSPSESFSRPSVDETSSPVSSRTRSNRYLIVWPDLPRFRVAHAAAALEDLSSGCDVVLGPAIDGGLYMVAIARPLPELFALPERTWRGDVMAVALTAIRDVGFEVGILRAERALHRPADVRAALADPMLPEDVATILRRHR